MPVLVCPRCSRINPGEASFCHFDGSELRGVGAGGGALGREFVFPSGRRCRTFDEWVRGCSEEWTTSRDLLRKGGIRQYLAGIGRMDLALVAERAATHADADIGLEQFLSQLPAKDAVAPRLDLQPRRLSLGKLKVGESRQIQINVTNQGGRLLHGTLQVEGDDWIRLKGGGSGSATIKTTKQQSFQLQIDTFGLVGGQRYAAKLTVLTNGGVAEVPITLEIIATPFPLAPLQGAVTPRDLALKMKSIPKQAVPLLEAGEVEKWFAANGWRYPVPGTPAKGIAAVQQFFEGMGLSKPPVLSLSDKDWMISCQPGTPVDGKITLKSDAKKWVYARVESDSPWLTVDEPDVGGAQRVHIKFTVDAKGLPPGRMAQGRLNIIANGGQKFTTTIKLNVQRAKGTVAKKIARPILVGALAAVCIRSLCGVPGLFMEPPVAFGDWLHRGADHLTQGHFVSPFVLMLGWLGIPIGVALAVRRGGIKDLLAGALWGFVTGVALAATAACAVQAVDQLLDEIVPWRVAGIALISWTGMGAAIGCIASLFGQAGRGFVSAIGLPFAWMFRRIGLTGLAGVFSG